MKETSVVTHSYTLSWTTSPVEVIACLSLCFAHIPNLLPLKFHLLLCFFIKLLRVFVKMNVYYAWAMYGCGCVRCVRGADMYERVVVVVTAGVLGTIFLF